MTEELLNTLKLCMTQLRYYDAEDKVAYETPIDSEHKRLDTQW